MLPIKRRIIDGMNKATKQSRSSNTAVRLDALARLDVLQEMRNRERAGKYTAKSNFEKEYKKTWEEMSDAEFWGDD